MTELTSYCDIILGNEEDAEKHFGIKPEGLDITTQGDQVKAEAFQSVCEQMMKKFPKAKKVITLRGSFPLLTILGREYSTMDKNLHQS